MSVLEADSTLSGVIRKHTQTTVMESGASAFAFTRVTVPVKQAWDNVIDDRLLVWRKNPALLEDEEVTPPSSLVIEIAIRLAKTLRDEGYLAPSSLVPNGEGGIVFEWKAIPNFETIEIHADGSVETLRFRDCKLQFRQRLHGPCIH